jgi:hypothetical protein
MANNNVASWTAGTILFGGKELHSVSAGSTADATPVGIDGNMVDHALAGAGRYIVFWEKANPSIFQTVLESAYVSDDDRIIVMELTGSATGGDVQIQSRDASHGASDKLNAESFNKIVAGTFSTGAMTGIVNPTYRESGVEMSSTGIKMWNNTSSISHTTPSISLSHDGNGLSFYNDLGSLATRYTQDALKFYNQTSASASDATTTAAFGATTLTFYDNAGFGAGNKTIEIVSTDTTVVGGVTGANNGLYIYGLTNKTTMPTDGSNLIMFNDGSTNRSDIGLWQNGSSEWLTINGGTAGVHIATAAPLINQGSIWLDASLSGGYVRIAGGGTGAQGFHVPGNVNSIWSFPTVEATDGYVLSASTQSTVATENVVQLEWVAAGGSGDITNVIAGTGLNGGATSGAATLTVDAAQTVISTMFNTNLIVGAGASHGSINFATDNAISFLIDGTGQVLLADGVLRPSSDSDVDLGTTSLRWKDAFVDSLTATNSVLHSTATASGSVPTASYGTFQYASAATGGNVLGFLSGQDSATPAPATERSSFWTMFTEGDASSNRLVFEPSVTWSSDSGFDNYSYIGYHHVIYQTKSGYLYAGDGSAAFPSYGFYGDADIDTGMYSAGTNILGFSTGGTARWSIDASGDLLPATDGSGVAGYDVGSGSYKVAAVRAYTLFFTNTASTSGTDLIVTVGGQIAKKTSSIRYKDNVETLEFDSSQLDKLRPVSYTYKFDDAFDIGLIAEEVNEIYPELIQYDEEGRPNSVKYDGLSVMLLEEVKNLRKEVKELKEKK